MGMMVPMMLDVIRGALHDDVDVQRVVPIVLALGRPRRSERQSRQSLQPGKVRDVVNRAQPAERTAGKVRHWESFVATISTQVAQQGKIRTTLTQVPLPCFP